VTVESEYGTKALNIPSLELFLSTVEPDWTRRQWVGALAASASIGIAFTTLLFLLERLFQRQPVSIDVLGSAIDSKFTLAVSFVVFLTLKRSRYRRTLTQRLTQKHFSGDLLLHTHAPVRAALDRCAVAALPRHKNPRTEELMERAFEAAGPFIRWDGVSYQDFKRTVAIDPDATEAVARIGDRAFDLGEAENGAVNRSIRRTRQRRLR